MARLSIFLIMVALIAGMVGCDGDQYNLTISSTEGGELTIPGTGRFPYAADTVVDLVASPDTDYKFVNWTGDVDTIADVEDATTTITMNGDYSITANFAPMENLEIRTWYDLDAIRDNLGGNHTLMNDLDFTTPGYEELASPTANGGTGWKPIGHWDPYDWHLYLAFTGTFDGQKYEIRDLFIDRPAENDVGLFGYVAEGGTVENVSVVNATVTGERYVGGLVGMVSGTVRNCYSSGKMAGDWWVGGVVGGIHDGTVTNCHSSASADGHEGQVGSLVGRNWGTISNSYSTGNVTCGWAWAGGLVGENRGTVTNSYSTGSVTGNETVGGLVGGYEVEQGTVSNSFWDTETSGQATSDGGTGKTTTEMQDIDTFLEAGWNIIAVAPGETNPSYTWNIVDGETYPFLSWQPVS